MSNLDVSVLSFRYFARKMREIILLLLFLSPGIFLCCRKESAKDDISLPEEMFADGDIVLRRGVGIMSHVVLAADEKSAFSHVGILKRIDKNWYVVHAVPDETEFEGDVDRVKIEPLSKFYAFNRASRGAVMRYRTDTVAAKRAAELAVEIAKRGTLFDHKYNLEDTTEMYCTELVNFVYGKSGIDISEGRRTEVHLPALGGIYIMPGDLTENKKLKLIYQFIR